MPPRGSCAAASASQPYRPNYHAFSKLLGAFDEDRRWTMHAVTAAADPAAAAGWKKFAAQMAAGNGEGGGAGSETARRVYSIVERWWRDRPTPLQPLAGPATFEFELQQPADNNHSLSSDLAYWGGYFWHARMDREMGDALAVVIFPTVGMDPHNAPDQDEPRAMLPCTWVKLQLSLKDCNTGQYVDQLQAPVCQDVAPTAALGYAAWYPVDSSSRRWRWRAFWDPLESPFLHHMVTVRVRVLLSMATPAEIGAA